MTLNQLDLLNADELLELAKDNVLAVDSYNLSELMLKIANYTYEVGFADAFDYMPSSSNP